MLARTRWRAPLGSALVVIAASVAVLVLQASQQSGGGNQALAAGAGIDNVGDFLERCPTNDSIYPLIRNDFQIRREGIVVGALSCTEPISAMPDAQYTDELIAVQALRTIFHMEGGRSVPYPWTQGTYYDWMKSKIGGVDIRANGSYCCENYNGKWFVVIRSQTAFERRQHKHWRGLAETIALLGHETRHVDGFPHVGGCPLFPTATYGCDQTYNPSNPSPYGIQWWLHAKWLSGEVNVGFGCLESAMTIATGHLNAANNDYRRRFVTQPPPVLNMPPQPGGPCAGSSPTETQTPSPAPTPTSTATPTPTPAGAGTPTPTPTPSPGTFSPTPTPAAPDFDGDGAPDLSDPDDDNDMLPDVDEDACGANSLNSSSLPERIDTPGDDDGDTLVNEALPPGSQWYDCDGDGFVGFVEASITTNDQDPCGGSGWPSDLIPDGPQPNTLNIADIGSFVVPVRRFGTNPGDAHFNARWDLVPGSAAGGTINLHDIGATVVGGSGYPPMFGGATRAFGKACPYAP